MSQIKCLQNWKLNTSAKLNSSQNVFPFHGTTIKLSLLLFILDFQPDMYSSNFGTEMEGHEGQGGSRDNVDIVDLLLQDLVHSDEDEEDSEEDIPLDDGDDDIPLDDGKLWFFYTLESEAK